MTETTNQDEDFQAPVLPGRGASDYERYLRTDELLSLQKSVDESVHRDELLFTTVHQTSELWLKLASNEVEEAARLLEDEEEYLRMTRVHNPYGDGRACERIAGILKGR